MSKPANRGGRGDRALNSFMEQKFKTDIGQKATVKREDIKNELATRTNAQLRDIGTVLNPIDQDTLKYMGSAAIHVYQSEMLGQLFFAAQTDTLQDMPETLAATAITELKGAMQTFYGRVRRTLRSGF